MVRNAFLVAVVVGVCLTGQTAVAQPARPPRPKAVNVAERLSKSVKFKFERKPLKEAVDDLKKRLEIPIVLDTKVFEEAAINLELPISGESNDSPALESINVLLNPFGIAAEIRHDVLFVSTMHAQSKWLVSRCYRLKPGSEPDALMKEITTQVGAQSWESDRGPGKVIKFSPSVLIVFQTQRHHREIEREFGKALLPVTTPPDHVAALSPKKGADPYAKMRAFLVRPASTDYAETPLAEMVADFGLVSHFEIVLDHKALEAAAVNAMTPVTANLKGIPLESSLTLVMNFIGLVWTIDGDKVLITTPTSACRQTVIYDVRDLSAVADENAITSALIRTVQPASWGAGKIKAGDAELSVTQTIQVHREIETWLADLRMALKPEAAKE